MLEHCDFETQAHVGDRGQSSPARPRRQAPRLPRPSSSMRSSPVRPTSSRCRLGTTRSGSRSCVITRARFGTTSTQAVREELLGPVRRRARVRRSLHSRRDVPERRARAGSIADRGRREPAGDPRDADDSDRSPAGRRLRLAPGDDRRVGEGHQRPADASSTGAWQRSLSTSRRSAAASTLPSAPTTRPSVRSRRGSCRAPGSSATTASRPPQSSQSSAASSAPRGP